MFDTFLSHSPHAEKVYVSMCVTCLPVLCLSYVSACVWICMFIFLSVCVSMSFCNPLRERKYQIIGNKDVTTDCYLT